MKKLIEILKNPSLIDFSALVNALSCSEEDFQLIYKLSAKVRRAEVGKEIYLRGLLEFSNFCEKDCYYCGIRKSNKKFKRYKMSDTEISDAVKIASENSFASIVIQSGERSDEIFINEIEEILFSISQKFPEIGITLSCGEQSSQTYKKWFKAGASRYLLRIESSNRKLYQKIHPSNKLHSFNKRVEALSELKNIGYQVGTGVMIGFHGQSIEDLASDLLFMKEQNIDMCGMGPYIEHPDALLREDAGLNFSFRDRGELTLRMIALLRIMMRDINIAATTSLETIDPAFRAKAFDIGANVLMPNLTPEKYREDYALYSGKKSLVGDPKEMIEKIKIFLRPYDLKIGLNKVGTSKHFIKRNKG